MDAAELQTKLFDTAGWMLDQFRSGGDWAINNAGNTLNSVSGETKTLITDLAREYIVYSMVFSWVSVATGVAMLIVFWKNFAKIVSLSKGGDGIEFICIVGGILVNIIAGALVFANIMNALKCTLAPKIFILERLADLIKH